MSDEPGPEPSAATPEAPEEGRTDQQASKPRLPLIDDEYPMLIDRDEEG
jgi:hypothetical protein